MQNKTVKVADRCGLCGVQVTTERRRRAQGGATAGTNAALPTNIVVYFFNSHVELVTTSYYLKTKKWI